MHTNKYQRLLKIKKQSNQNSNQLLKYFNGQKWLSANDKLHLSSVVDVS